MKILRVLIFLLMLLAGAAIAKGQGFQPFPAPPGSQITLDKYLGYTINDSWDWAYRPQMERYYNSFHRYPRNCYRYYGGYHHRRYYRWNRGRSWRTW